MPPRIERRLRDFSRAMRREPTPFEDRLWQALRGRQLEGLKFSRQVVVDGLICDFACRDRTLLIEIDGDTHDGAKDADRDWRLSRLGFLVLRFTNREIGDNLPGVVEVIRFEALKRPTKLERAGADPRLAEGVTHPPAPSLGREGEV